MTAVLVGCADTDDPLAAPASSSAPITSASPSIRVVTSRDVYGDIVRTIGGDRVAVTEIITSAGQDPHSFDASARDQLAVAGARVIIENGGGYDEFMTRLRSASGGDAASIIAVEVAGGAGETGDEAQSESTEDAEGQGPHEGGNEHVWYDLDAMGTLAERVADELAELDPASRETFGTNATAFVEEHSELQSRLAAIEEESTGTAVAVTEPLPEYLIEDAGLVNRTPGEFSEAIEEGSDVPARVFADTLALLTGGQVDALIYNDQTTGPQTEQLREAAESDGIPVVAVTETLPEGVGYLEWMDANIDALENALS